MQGEKKATKNTSSPLLKKSPGSNIRTHGRVKIFNAVVKLLNEKSFRDITWGEVAREAEVSESLMYQYYKDKTGLLFGVLEQLLDQFEMPRRLLLRGTYGAINKLRLFIWDFIKMFSENRCLSKALLLEQVYSFPSFPETKAFQIIREHQEHMLDIIREGVYSGEIKDEIEPKYIQRMIQGSIEQLCLHLILADREIPVDELTDIVCHFILSGIGTNPPSTPANGKP